MRSSFTSNLLQVSNVQGAARLLTAGVLCALMVELPVYAELARPAHGASKHTRETQMAGRQRVLHALNRLTFGPRPEDVAEVERVGLKKWFESQLTPQKIDDSALEARLAAFPAMTLPQQELMHRYPSPQMLRVMVQQHTPLPQDPIEHAIYAHGIAFYKDAEDRKAAAQAASGTGAAAPAMADAANVAAPRNMADADNMNAGTDQRRRRGGRVDLLGDGSSEYLMATKKAALSPGLEATQSSTEANKQPKRGAGRPEHDEQAFPEAETLEILALPPEDRVRRILALDPTRLLDFRRSLSQQELAAVARDFTPQQKEIFAALQGAERMVGAEVLESRLDRDVYSRRQVEAVMTDFWLNHFNVYLRKNQNEPYFLPAYERETIRPFALGRFEDLLVATARSPAMLTYLDNWESVGPNSLAAQRGPKVAALVRNPKLKQALNDRGLNENYARELMELHTLGVGCEVSRDHPVTMLDPACGRGYSQADVTEVAKVFSGWTIDRPNQGGEYKFEDRRHEPGTKSVLGQSIHEGGEKEGLEVLHMLAMSPATARFISAKLAVRFVSDTPPPALVDRMAKSYLASGGEIRSVLRTMFDSPEFWSTEVYRSKVKTPLEFVASALRATDADVTNPTPLVQSLDRLGMPLYGMQTPNGYSWVSEPWVSTGALVSRMNFALVLSSDKLPGTRANWGALLGQSAARPQPVATSGDASGLDVADQEKRLEDSLLAEPVSDRTRQAVLAESADPAVQKQAERDFLSRPKGPADAPGISAAAPSTPGTQAATMAGLLLGSPEFQRR